MAFTLAATETFKSSAKLSRQVFYNSCNPELTAIQAQIDRLTDQQAQARKLGPLFATKVSKLERAICDARSHLAVVLNGGI